MRRPMRAAMSLATVLLATVAVLAEEPRDNAQDEKAIREMVATYKQALRSGDAEAIAGLWAPEGDFVNAMGQYVQGREAIQREFEAFFSGNPGAEIKTTPISLRFITPEVAIADGLAHPVPAPPGPPVSERYTVVYRKQDGKWMIESVRETLTSPPSNYERLAELEWMIGRWRYYPSGPGSKAVRTSCRWDMNKTFIVREFTARLADGTTLAGVQRIGWDPLKKAIHSWLFESSGACLEGDWTRDGQRWIVKTAGALPDGRRVSATNVVTKVDEDTFTFEARERTSDGQPLPDSAKIELKRVRDPGIEDPGPAAPAL